MQPVPNTEEQTKAPTHDVSLLGLLAVVAAGSRMLGNALTAPGLRPHTPRPQPSYERFLRTGERPDVSF